MFPDINFKALSDELLHAFVGLGMIGAFISSEYRLGTYEKIKKEKMADEAEKEMRKKWRAPGETHTAPTNEEERAYMRKKDQEARKCEADLAECRRKLRSLESDLH